jgi:hypothetical protein
MLWTQLCRKTVSGPLSRTSCALVNSQFSNRVVALLV